MLANPNVGRVEARRAATRAEIVDAAWDLVREQGLGALSLRDLAARVGMRAPSLYSYFESKHAIYDALFADGCRQALALQRVDMGADDPRAALKARTRQFLVFCMADPARTQLLFQRPIPDFEPSPESYALAVEHLSETARMFTAMGIDNPAHLDLWTSIVSGLISQQLANEPGGDRWTRLSDDAVDMFFDYVGVATKPEGKKSR